MLNWLRISLSTKVRIAAGVIFTLALFSAASALLIAKISQGDASAINTAGSLRMSTYRLMWEIEKGNPQQRLMQLGEDMQQRFDSETLTSRLGTFGNADIRNAYRQVYDQWNNAMFPALLQRDKAAFQSNVAPFVERLEHFVQLLQMNAETRQTWQQVIQGIALLLTIVILLVGMYEMRHSVLLPLRKLVMTTEHFSAGNLGARVAYRSDDELGTVADSFNAMAEVIEQSHKLLESRVAEKTRNLARSNSALELLLSSSRKMANGSANVGQLEELVDSFQKHLPDSVLTLCLRGDDYGAKKPIALRGNAQRMICSINDCSFCDLRTNQHGKVVSIISQGKTLGEIHAVYEHDDKPDETEGDILQALADFIGTILSLESQRERTERLLLMEERTIIARELHDSLAQELSFMKFQVSSLRTLILRSQHDSQILKISDELREGLNNAYRHLRELLTTFRLQIRDGGLDKALNDTVREFAERGNLKIDLRCEPLAFSLSSNEQINVLQIVREALSNCVRHAKARYAHVSLHQDAGHVTVSIEDDGIGIDNDFDSSQHHGLSIMQERASSLNGELRLNSEAGKGTRIQLQFSPEFLAYSDIRALM